MHRATRSRPEQQQQPEWSIPGDPQEEDRIRLEKDIANKLGELTLENTDTHSTEYSIEYPRHGGAGVHSPHGAYGEFPSFAAPGNDVSRFEYDQVASPGHPQDMFSYRTGDESVVRAGETLSTAHHHASAVTLGAGLGGRYGTTPTRSRSGAEFDPERPLPDMFGNRNNNNSLFEDTHASLKAHVNSEQFKRTNNSRNNSHSRKGFLPMHTSSDPLIVEDTAELDRAVESGRFQVPQYPAQLSRHQDNFRDGSHSITSSSESSFRSREAATSPVHGHADTTARRNNPRAKLSDALGKVNYESDGPAAVEFSPKRPRNVSSKKTSRNSAISDTHPGSLSHFGKTARGLVKEIEKEKQSAGNLFATTSRKVSPSELDAIAAAGNNSAAAGPSSAPAKQTQFQFPGSRHRSGFSVHLPDVTGLTSAVESPNKAARLYKDAVANEADATVVNAAIERLATRLRELEKENVTSRRRVRELELDLVTCKAEVVRERTNLQIEVQKQHDLSIRASDRKGKGRATALQVVSEEEEEEPAPVGRRGSKAAAASNEDSRIWEARYKEVVETKKALESLVTSLRAQLAQMTQELESHKRMVDELRMLRESDEVEIEEKIQEVEELRGEVERLGAEVQRLRGIIEESVNERRKAREAKEDEESRVYEVEVDMRGRDGDLIALSPVQEEETAELTATPDRPQHRQRQQGQRPESPFDGYAPDAQPSIVQQRPPSRAGTSSTRTGPVRPSSRLAASRNANDQAEDGENIASFRRTPPLQAQNQSQSQIDREFQSRATVGSSLRDRSRRFIGAAELSQLEADVEERRSMRSDRSATPDAFETREQQQHHPRKSRHSGSENENEATDRSITPQNNADPSHTQARTQHQSRRTRFAQTPRPKPRQFKPQSPANDGDAFPQIRGERLERLFFSLPEHNEATCTVCRRNGGRGHDGHADEDEGFHEPPGWIEEPRVELGARLAKVAAMDEDDRVPPQTVLARTLRELEDDFTHYKSMYLELAEQYGGMDPACNALKRNVLAEHLKEVIDTLEQKGDQIAELYDLLSLKDRQVHEKLKQKQSERRASGGITDFVPASSSFDAERRRKGTRV